ncbi:MraY family glycosyltransferase [Pseudomonas sp. BNK-43-a]|uniref:MraY family glycosyltransferase n=1 Tax=unclassified Pseudomonas TaxID=196821 RepID=UPI0039BF27EE
MLYWLYTLAALVAALLLTGALRRYALKRNIIDIPNSRSSHKIPTPRGGGVAIVLSTCAFSIVLVLGGEQTWGAILPLLLPGLLIAAIGFLDDHGHIAARWRLLGHFAAAFAALWLLPARPVVEVFGWEVDLSVGVYVFFSLYLVWMLNLYNFMDGIDGLASVEAICVCSGAILAYAILGNYDLIWLPAVLSAAVAGFLFWNFPPARIFMGDAGSGFLGISLGALSVQAALVEPKFLWMWLILLGVFIVDATATLLRRMLRGDKVYEAHRSHAYQHAALGFSSHKTVTLSVVALNLCWLLPLSLTVALLDWNGTLVLMVAYLPLIALAIKWGAGQPNFAVKCR